MSEVQEEPMSSWRAGETRRHLHGCLHGRQHHGQLSRPRYLSSPPALPFLLRVTLENSAETQPHITKPDSKKDWEAESGSEEVPENFPARGWVLPWVRKVPS